MKKKLFTLLLILISMSATAQTVGKPFYIYQHDGSFNAFLKEDVDSITYSNIGLDDKEYDDVVTQLVFTKDSLYRIPIANIDSVSFVTPQTILNKNVFPLTSAHDPYIVNGDTISFKMLLTTPDNMRPKEGNIVISTYDCNAFPVGIIARVTSITKSTDGYAYTCEKASIDDVYDQIVVYEENIAGPDSVHEAKGPMRAQRSVSTTLWDKTYKKDWDIDGTTTNFNANDKAWITITIRKTLKTPLFANFSIQNKLTTKVDFNAKKEIHIDKSTQIGPTLNIGRIFIPYTLLWIQPQLSLDGYFKLDGQVELNYSGHLDRTDRADLTYCNNNWSFTYTPTSDVGTDIANISMKGYAEVGLIPDLFFSLCGSGTGLGMRASVGLKESIDFLFDATKLKGGGLYDACKESYCKTTIPYSVEVYANANLLNNHTEVAANASVTYSKEPQWGSNKYILPLFTNPYFDESNATINTNVSRDIISPAITGLRLYDSNGNIIEEHTTPSPSNSFQNKDLSFVFTNLQSNTSYKVCPTVKLFNYTMEATPILNFNVDGSTHVITGKAFNITNTSAVIPISVLGSFKSTDKVKVGVLYCDSDYSNIQINGTKIECGTSPGKYSVNLTGLKMHKDYVYCAYIEVNGELYYGKMYELYLLNRDALKKFYDSTNGSKWYHNDNWNTDEPCNEWYGIHYPDIDLSNNNLTGDAIISDFDIMDNILLQGNNLNSVSIINCPFLDLGNRFRGLDGIKLNTLKISNCLNGYARNLVCANIKNIYISDNTYDVGISFIRDTCDCITFSRCSFKVEGGLEIRGGMVNKLVVDSCTTSEVSCYGCLNIEIKNSTVCDYYVFECNGIISITNSYIGKYYIGSFQGTEDELNKYIRKLEDM